MSQPHQARIGLDNPIFSGRLRPAQFAEPAPSKPHWQQPADTVGQPVVVPKLSMARITTTRQPARISYRDAVVLERPEVQLQPLLAQAQPIQSATIVHHEQIVEPVPAVEPIVEQLRVEPVAAPAESKISRLVIAQTKASEATTLLKQWLTTVKKPSLDHPLVQKLRNVPGELHQMSGLQVIFVALAGFIMAIGLTVSFQAWQTNHSAAAKVEALSQKSQSGSTDEPKVQAPGTPPSTSKPSTPSINSYQVPASHPRYIDIPKLDVHARILSLGLTKDGALATPGNVFDTGWYNGSSLPGQAGAMLIDGHVSSWTTNGVFYGIKTLKAGDTIQVSNGQGTVFNYQVVKTQIFDHDQVDMQSAVQPVNPGKPGLNLITCTGDVIRGTNEFNERVIVYAEQL
ncbi:MAG TPA: sortase [Candidatus Saccharimonadales bacterium]|nr:sortase [Candidatus Saccharimonadales bacterium]